MNQYRKLDAEKALELAGNLPWTCPIEVHNDMKTDWRLLKTDILTIGDYCVRTKWFNPFRRPISGRRPLRSRHILLQTGFCRGFEARSEERFRVCSTKCRTSIGIVKDAETQRLSIG